MKNNRWMSMLLILAGASSYGMLSPCIKLAYAGGWDEARITAVQAAMGTALMWLLVALVPGTWKNPFSGPWVRLSLTGVFGLAMTTVFYNETLEKLDASVSIVLLFQFTWITILLECVASKRWPTLSQGLAIAAVMIGTMLAVDLFKADWGRLNGAGIALGLASACTYSIFLFAAGKVETDFHPLLKSAVMLTAGLLVILAIYPPAFVAEPHVGSLLLWGLWLGALGQVIPTICFLIGIPGTGSTVAALLGSLELPVAIIGAFFILREPVSWPQWLGMLLILGGILLSAKQTKQKQETHA